MSIGNTHLGVWNIPHIGGVGRDTLLCEPNWNVHQNLKPWLKTKTTSYSESFQLGSSYAAHVVLLGLAKEVVHITQVTTFFCTCTAQKVLIGQCGTYNNLQSQAICCVCTSGIGFQIQLSFWKFLNNWAKTKVGSLRIWNVEPLGSWCHIKWKNKQPKKRGTRQSSLLNLELGNTGKDISNLREKNQCWPVIEFGPYY